ncbi:hypothetical protein F8M41_003073 [Gigaspora margarita]|uniref:F-box domain-containing protein n=1 Tax=Gigaspora margarita TaxID=4874 RepID=A0A8H3XCK3_GIGMA|nr:hypothetical protein F8M41_003073 [Gigaspora margarita]
MASKIFMGDMPELMEKIFNNLNNEIYSLHSCALVSRHWCKMSIPMLWRNPFSFSKSSNFISNYISSLKDNDKFNLKEYGIVADFPNTLFNYARFLKVLNLSHLDKCVKQWMNKTKFNQQDKDKLKCHIINLLLKIFIESGAILYRLDLEIYENDTNFSKINPEVIYLLKQKMNFFSRLRVLSVDVVPGFFVLDFEPESESESESEYAYNFKTITLLNILAKSTMEITELKVNLCGFYDLPQLYNDLAYIIKSQKHLEWFNISCIDSFSLDPSGEYYGIILALNNQKTTLKEIIINKCDYSAEFEILGNCENLEVIRITQCDEEIIKILNNKISILEINSNDSIDASNIIQTLERSGSLLQRLKLDMRQNIKSQSSLLETLMTFCPNITYLYISRIKLSTQFFELIKSLRNLQFFTICWDEPTIRTRTKKNELESNIIKLAGSLPSTLHYLDLSKLRFGLFIDILLDHCDAPLKSLSFRVGHNMEKKIEALIRFCRRKMTLNVANVNVLGKNKEYLEEYVKLVPYNSFVVDC